MRFVEFVGLLVALIGLFAWLLGRPHTLESIDRNSVAPRVGEDAPRFDEPARDGAAGNDATDGARDD